IRYIENPAETGRAIKNFVGVDNKIGMFAGMRHYRRRRMGGSQIASVEWWNIIVGGQKPGGCPVLDIKDDHSRIAPGSIQPVVVIHDLMALNDLLLSIRAEAVQRSILLAPHLTLHMPRAYRFDGFGITVIDDQK